MTDFEIEFDEQVIEIAVLSFMRKCSGDNRLKHIRVLAWQDIKSGEVFKDDTSLFVKGDSAQELNKRLYFKSVIKVKAQRSREGFKSCFMLVKTAGGGFFPKLKKIEKEIRAELAENKSLKKQSKTAPVQLPVIDEALGELKYNISLQALTGRMTWLGNDVDISIKCESSKLCEASECLKALTENKAQWDEEARSFAAKKLLAGAIDWNEQDNLNEEDIKGRIALTNITTDIQGNFEFWFNDDNIFLGHSILIGGSLKDGLLRADIVG